MGRGGWNICGSERFGFDAIIMMTDMLEGGSLTRSRVREVLEQGFSYSGVFGNVDLPRGTHDIRLSLFPVRILGGKLA